MPSAEQVREPWRPSLAQEGICPHSEVSPGHAVAECPTCSWPGLRTWEKPPAGTAVTGDSADGAWAVAPWTRTRASRAHPAALEGMAWESRVPVARKSGMRMPGSAG